MQRENSIVRALAAELVRLKVDVIVSGGPTQPARQGSNFYDSHCHDPRS